jgi:hypothetical protein
MHLKENQNQMNIVKNNQKQLKGNGKMRVQSVKPVGVMPVYDISVADAKHYIMENGAVTHNTGIYYSADTIWIIGRQQDKDDKELLGYHFIINIEKSRYVKEKSKIPITVNFNSGINKWSGMLDLAIDGGYIVKPKQGWYARIDKTTGEIGKNYRAGDIIDNKDFWKLVFTETDFATWIKEKYTYNTNNMMNNDLEE